MAIRELKVEQLPYKPEPYTIGDRVYPGVSKNEDGTYSIRILGGYSANISGSKQYSYAYFKLDSSGLIIESPRGQSKFFNKKVRITDIDEVAAREHAAAVEINWTGPYEELK